LHRAGSSKLRALIGRHRWVFIDEAQRIRDVGLIAKIITDQFKDVQLIISGSSALELNQSTQEPLTGRKVEFPMFPISWEEFEDHVGVLEGMAQLEERIVFGMYPDVINHRSEARDVLHQLTSSYLYKDVLSRSGIQKPELLDRLLKALALQLGNEVSFNELAGLLEVDKATVSKYIDLLEKTFIVFRLTSFSRNLRNEIKNNRKIYFHDNGIRNAIIQNLNGLDLRADKGALWENFLISERMKMRSYRKQYANANFWRTVQKQEIDLIEERDGQLHAFEFKWKRRGKDKLPASFMAEYGAIGHVIDKENFREFVRG
jgi:predicted AAA+ superfamily ATPase